MVLNRKLIKIHKDSWDKWQMSVKIVLTITVVVIVLFFYINTIPTCFHFMYLINNVGPFLSA